MYEASDIELIYSVAGGVGLTLRGDYIEESGHRRYMQIEFDRAAVEFLIAKLENWLAETR